VKSEEKNKPFNPFKMQWKVNEYRADKRTGAISPITRSSYVQKLFIETELWRQQP